MNDHDYNAEIEQLRAALAALADAADAVGVRHFDTDWLDDDVQAMKEATMHARRSLVELARRCQVRPNVEAKRV